MRRVFWIGVGVAVTVVVVTKGRQVIARYAPASLVDQATTAVDDAGARVTGFWRDFRAEFAVARAEREAELEAALLAEGQDDPAVVRARRAAARGAHAAPPDDEDELGYSFY